MQKVNGKLIQENAVDFYCELYWVSEGFYANEAGRVNDLFISENFSEASAYAKIWGMSTPRFVSEENFSEYAKVYDCNVTE
jgi:hypothetical protein